jgi:hypothetical protein
MRNLKKIIIIIVIFLAIVFFIKNYDIFKAGYYNIIIIKRGIFAPNKYWSNLSNKYLKDGNGVNYFYENKKKYGRFPITYMLGVKLRLVTNNDDIKIILDNSPDIFGPGELKQVFFSQFMPNNVGISVGCPWKKRRSINTFTLDSEKLIQNAELYNRYMIEILEKNKNDYKQNINYKFFKNIGNYMVQKIIFNDTSFDADRFLQAFQEYNNLTVFFFRNKKIKKDVREYFYKVLYDSIDNPKADSLIYKMKIVTKDRDEIFNQICHLIFPLNGILFNVLPRIIILIFNHPECFSKLVNEINETNNSGKDIYEMSYLRNCILESLRLNNPLITTFRSLNKDFTFYGKDKNYDFKKGTQLLILNNPVLRDPFFTEPNKFKPSRWNKELEESYYAIQFNQGPQKCPGKELVLFLLQNAIYNFMRMYNIKDLKNIDINKIETKYVPQFINPYSLNLNIKI